MKKILSIATAASLLLVACNKEGGKTAVVPAETGEKATVHLQLSFPRTYADETATAAESEVGTIDVMIFDAANGNMVNSRQFTKSDFTPNGSLLTKDGIVTTSGERYIAVAVNLPDAIRRNIVSTVKNVSALNTDTIYDVTAADIATANKFTMINTTLNKVNIIPDTQATATDNKISVSLERLAGKGALTLTSDYAVSANIAALGTMGDLEYKIMQTNKKTFLLADIDHKDPNWLSGDFVTPGPGTAPQYGPEVFESSDAFKAVEAHNAYTDHSLRPAFYGAENTSDFYQKGATVYFMVRAHFTPSKAHDNTGAEIAHTFGAGDNFWVVQNADKLYIAATSAVANQIKANTSLFPADDAVVVEHYGGYCYWPVWVGSVNKREFIRNNYYVGQVKAINGLGAGDEDEVVPDPELPDPVDGEKATIEVSFDILPWTFNLGDPVELN